MFYDYHISYHNIILYVTVEYKCEKYTALSSSLLSRNMKDVTVLNFGKMCSALVQFSLLSVCTPRNLVAFTSCIYLHTNYLQILLSVFYQNLKWQHWLTMCITREFNTAAPDHCCWHAVTYGNQCRDYIQRIGHAGTTAKYRLRYYWVAGH
jgi:hypothetical protein